ncbi:MAG: hypothetical protein A3G52_02735 [Candidatus Taylorbacteria bacterium RIFCSPLOWO2_12_FULL_43_20]|uniref:Uncharacterized protein n=1 Tax=Candidatus Taylorbacteria bacterium RIFCSPLOWO2_12_FULL_43_20 TaxID=1802332 RepID=A0A1G2NZN2_9BACT|nr:MAG: hypothetical protein A2825_02915 [Candidatus Taylorbacteria bacterium RIFCSPHIGHO2_01_FULL_43_120]OHA23640.1 MAG: hypothetical protein A3B98_03230 [Candidatus Taylorbacteria bacterium RIFCSPHIGHO2_02_FULL_43_55]OHA28115.1 MAG: hypothetical protein A3E92_00220 [Candidatus Taylorbacteria bacterium RIFCSPHIGHO2_12_FULL_42_34]OHA32328.1 MAG: hypothetical protein A3B09_03140 [Candidatus Taylorbacteria bacterium RIFCSPLOWO2_01_FULL_43_83]OHA37665.1 MAG: hypothetical protein A3H58_03260 [Candi
MRKQIKNMQPSKRTFQKDGKWMEKPTSTNVLVCLCGRKYIETRKEQQSCVKCMGDKESNK